MLLIPSAAYVHTIKTPIMHKKDFFCHVETDDLVSFFVAVEYKKFKMQNAKTSFSSSPHSRAKKVEEEEL